MRQHQSVTTKLRPTTSRSNKSLKSSIEKLESLIGQRDYQEDERKRKYLNYLALMTSNKHYFLRSTQKSIISIKERPKTSLTKVSTEKTELKMLKKVSYLTHSLVEFNHEPNTHRLEKHFIVDFSSNYDSQVVEQSFRFDNDSYKQETNIEQQQLCDELFYSKIFNQNDKLKENSIDSLSQQLDTNVYNLKNIRKPKLKRSMTLNSNNEFGKIILESYNIETESKLLINSTDQLLSKNKPKLKFINWNKRGKLLVFKQILKL